MLESATFKCFENSNNCDQISLNASYTFRHFLLIFVQISVGTSERALEASFEAARRIANHPLKCVHLVTQITSAFLIFFCSRARDVFQNVEIRCTKFSSSTTYSCFLNFGFLVRACFWIFAFASFFLLVRVCLCSLH